MARTTTLYLRSLPTDLVRKAKAEAALRGKTLGVVVTEALSSALLGAPVDESDHLAGSMAWYAKNKARLLRRYAGQYVAIVDEGVADHDHDFEAMATRVFRRFGSRPVFMPRVTSEEVPLRVRSPRRSKS